MGTATAGSEVLEAGRRGIHVRSLDMEKANTRGFVTEQRGSMWLTFPSEGSFQAALFQKIACTSNTGIFFMGLHNRCRVVFVAFL